MPTDADFLTAIAAAPADRLPRLVYADWLDERGDPRGELIRLEEETRERVAWDDTLWRLKPRRNELRRQTDADWLKAMDYGQTCEPLFRGQPFPIDVRDAWRLIREAHERWTGEPLPDVGGHADKIAEAEQRLGLTLPASVREYVAFAHDRPQSEGMSAEMIAIYRDWYTLEVVPAQPAISLIQQREGDVHWAVRYEDMHIPDPPVFTYAWQRDESGEYPDGVFLPRPEVRAESLTRFLFGYARGYVVRDGRSGEMCLGVQDVQETRSALNRDFPFHGDIGGEVLYESPNYSATFTVPGYRDPGWVDVQAYRRAVEAEMPECVREWFRAGAGCNGILGDLRYGYVNGVPPTLTLPPERPSTELSFPEVEWSEGDDIPF